MNKLLFALAAASVALPAATALAADPPAAAAPAVKLTTAESTLGALLDNAAAKAVLTKHIPAVVGNPQIEMARSMTLKQIQGMVGDALSDEVFAKIDLELAAIK